MSDPYGKVKGGRLTFKGGILASRGKTIDKKKKKNKKTNNQEDAVGDPTTATQPEVVEEAENSVAAEVYTIDAAKRMKYEELFPVETKKFGYEHKKKQESKSVEDALDDRVKKKADRYCK